MITVLLISLGVPAVFAVGMLLGREIGYLHSRAFYEELEEKYRWVSYKMHEEHSKRVALQMALKIERRRRRDSEEEYDDADWWKGQPEEGSSGI